MRGFYDYRRSLAMTDYHAEQAEERRRQETERRIMGGGYQPTPKNTPLSRPVDSDDLIETGELEDPRHDP